VIVAQQKPLDEIREMLAGYRRPLVLGCGTCVTVCFAGGEKEVALLATSLRAVLGEGVEIAEALVQRQCEWEFLDQAREAVERADVVLSLGCGVGVQGVAEHYPGRVTLPGLNTTGLALTEAPGVWTERCLACGDCLLDLTGGVCPIARCAKSLLNGPCGGAQDGHCEISTDIPCAWVLIHERLTALGRQDLLEEIIPTRDWRTSHSGGPRRISRPDLQEPAGEEG